MAIAGSWAANNRFTGVGKWGNGINPVHYSRDEGRGREVNVHIPVDQAPVDAPPEELIGHDWGYGAGDYYGEEGYQLRYVNDRPGWGEHVKRDDIPVNYPEPGVSDVTRQEAVAFHEIPHMSAEEAERVAAVQPSGYRGGWAYKAKGEVNKAMPSDPKQYELNTSMRQGAGVGVMTNDRAVARGLPARAPIQSRAVGMIVKRYAKSFELGGGPGTPRMFPYQQSGLKRPFFFRSPGLPRPEIHTMNTAEGRLPLQYQTPPLPDPGAEVTSAADSNYGYTDSGDWY